MRLGGGVCAFIDSQIPYHRISKYETTAIESLWFTLRPFRLPRAVSSILVAVIYHPTDYGASENLALVEHIRLNVDLYLSSHPDGLAIICGDFNGPSTGLTERQVKHATGLTQVVKVLTRDSGILDWCFTNRSKLFLESVQLPKIGRSNHFAILLESRSSQVESKTRTKVIYKQNLRDSRLRDFGNWITRQDWSEVLSLSSATEKCDKFYQEKMRGQRGRLRALAGICHVHDNYS